MLESSFQIDSIIASIYKYSIDLTYPAFSILCDWWYRELNQKFDVLHDDSKAMEYWKDMIEFTSNPHFMEEKEVGYGSRKMIYPLKVDKLKFKNSKTDKKIQLADLVASSAAFLLKELNTRNLSAFSKSLMDTKLFNLYHHAIIPTNKISPEDLGMEDDTGQNPLDYFADMANKSKNEFNKIDDKMK